MSKPLNYSSDKSNDRGHLLTELSNRASSGLDEMDTKSLVDIFVEEDLLPQLAVSNAKKEICMAIDSISERLRIGGRLFYLGAGTSGRLGVLDAAECPPTFCTDPETVQGIIAGGKSALVKSSEGLEDDPLASVNDLKEKSLSSLDSLLGISAGGTTPYVKSGLHYAKSLNALTLSISSVPSAQVLIESDIDIRLLTGPELVTGSTRLKAGTATKMALNIISTCVMVRLGKVYDNYMIDLNASNSKLIDRAIRIIVEISSVNNDTALNFLERSNGSVKKALLMIASGIVNIDQIDLLLNSNDSNLRKTMENNGYKFEYHKI